jgi:hypothetical protein
VGSTWKSSAPSLRIVSRQGFGHHHKDLQDVFQVGALGADAQVVEDGVALLVVKLGGVTLGLLGRFDGVEVGIGLGLRSLLATLSS